MTEDFNTRDSDQDPNFYYYFVHTNNLITIANSLGLELFSPSNPGSTRYTNNPWNTNLVLDLIFLLSNNTGFGQHSLYSEMQKPSDYVPLIIEVGIKKVNIDITIQSIKKNSNDTKKFIKSLINSIEQLNTTDITSKEDLQNIVLQLATTFEKVQFQYSKLK